MPANLHLTSDEGQYQRLFDQNPMMLFVMDSDGLVLMVNDAGARHLGYEKSELIGTNVLNVFVEEDRPEVLRHTQQCLKDPDAVFKWTARKRRKNGEILWVDEVASMVPQASGQPQLFVACEDVTSRKAIEQRMESSRIRLMAHQQELVRLTGQPQAEHRTFEEFLRDLTETAVRVLGVARSSVWRFNTDRSKLISLDLFERAGGVHRSGEVFDCAPYPNYMAALAGGRPVLADDVQASPIMKELLETYYVPYGITSAFDVPIIIDGQLDGVVCFDSVGPPRRWEPDEVSFATALANLAVLAIEQDARLRLEAALKQAERDYRTIFENLPIGVYRSSPDGKQLRANPALVALNGYSSESEMLMNVHDIATEWYVDPNRRSEFQRVLHSLSSLADFESEVYRHKTRERIWISESAHIVRDSAGRVAFYEGTVLDITERKKREDELLVQSRVLANMLEGVALYDENGVCHYTNPAEDAMLGYARGEMIGKHFGELLGYTRREFRKVVVDALATLEAVGEWQGEIQSRRKDGRVIDTYTRISRVEISGRRFWVCVQTDVTEKKRAERFLQEQQEELRRRTDELGDANRELEAFVYSVSHDLRAPLRGIDGFSKALLEDYSNALDERGQDYINRVRAATLRMGRLIDDLLNLSRLTRSQIARGKVNMSELAQRIVSELERSEPDRSPHVWIEPNLVAYADANLIRIVLENLLGNAWKFTRKTPEASILLGRDPADDSVFFVRDNGAGFDMAYAGKLFGAFQRLHRLDEFEGTGIGLATVQRIIHRHGGRVWAEGEVGRGATFYFALPDRALSR